ncbi:hypothetical protein SKAU_G00298420 [Synaphobranchus kaupii]|uniref:Uncharacterized protein n=1 Tax=Synaphobranchus kaupii TaxID=118154 RepID=A0A9Q1EV83_SYNKA|nr:hypothetical protein SKAU_G00298420 [Synaphobranchus kaupii]
MGGATQYARHLYENLTNALAAVIISRACKQSSEPRAAQGSSARPSESLPLEDTRSAPDGQNLYSTCSISQFRSSRIDAVNERTIVVFEF